MELVRLGGCGVEDASTNQLQSALEATSGPVSVLLCEEAGSDLFSAVKLQLETSQRPHVFVYAGRPDEVCPQSLLDADVKLQFGYAKWGASLRVHEVEKSLHVESELHGLQVAARPTARALISTSAPAPTGMLCTGKCRVQVCFRTDRIQFHKRPRMRIARCIICGLPRAALRQRLHRQRQNEDRLRT